MARWDTEEKWTRHAKLFYGPFPEKSRAILAPGSGPMASLEMGDFIATFEEDEDLPYGPFWFTANASSHMVKTAYKSRVMMWKWMGIKVDKNGNKVYRPTPEAAAVGVEYASIMWHLWYIGLSEYKFMINVIGAGLQTGSTFEALMVCTIPIIIRMDLPIWDQFLELGFPIVAVHSFDEITPRSVARWWDALSPRLHSFRINCLTEDGWWQMAIGDIPCL